MIGLSFSLKRTEDTMLRQEGTASNVGVGDEQEVNENRVSKALLKGEVTQEVKNLRYRTYKVDEEAKETEYYTYPRDDEDMDYSEDDELTEEERFIMENRRKMAPRSDGPREDDRPGQRKPQQNKELTEQEKYLLEERRKRAERMNQRGTTDSRFGNRRTD